MPKVIPPSRQTQQHTRVSDASRILKRFYVAERQLIRAYAAWFIKTAHVKTKFRLAEHLYLATQNADRLRARVLELRYPRRDVEKKFDPDVLAFTDALINAETPEAFIAGVYGVALPALVRELTAYLSRTDALDDWPTVQVIRHVLTDTQYAIDTMPQEVGYAEWCAYLNGLLASAGGLSGLEPRAALLPDPSFANRPPFQIPRTNTRDPRFRPALFHLPHENKYDTAGQQAWKRIEALDKRVAMQVWSAISHFNEIWAAEIPASLLYDLSDQPWEFYLDFSRWAWDEARHSMMGYRAMQGWGWDIPALIPYGTALYNALGGLPPAQRLALLHYYEEGLLRSGTKQTEIKILESAGDEGSIQDMDFDWADEAIHVGYGFKWLRHLLGDDDAGQERLKALTDEAREIMAAYIRAHKDQPEAQLAPYFERLYPVVEQMMQTIPDDGLNVQWSPVVADETVLEKL